MSLTGEWLHTIRQWWWFPLRILFVEAKGDPELVVWSYPASSLVCGLVYCPASCLLFKGVRDTPAFDGDDRCTQSLPQLQLVW